MIVNNLEIIDITEQGQGIARKDNIVYFVEEGIIGEIVDIEIVVSKKNYILCRKLNTIKESPFIVESKCKYYRECSGCSMQNIDYKKQLELKKELVKNQLQRIGNHNIDKTNIVGLENPYYYRNKVELKVDNKFNIGYYYKNSHKLVAIDECIVASEIINKVIKKIKEIIKKYKIEGFSRKTGKGIIKNITIRSNYLEEVQLTITISKENFKNKNEFFEDIFKIPEIIELYYSVNKNRNSEIMGNSITQVYSRKDFIDKIGELKFKISPKSFFQVNSLNTENLYNIALKQMKLQGKENILDLYCGIGTTTIYFGENAKSSIGVEIVKDAIKDANHNKILNNLNNIEFVEGKSEDKITELLQANIDIVVVDPPRKGLDKSLIDILGNSKITKIEYISCNPATLSRDLKYFKEYGFEVEEIELCDMFPHTMHVETVILMSRVDN